MLAAFVSCSSVILASREMQCKGLFCGDLVQPGFEIALINKRQKLVSLTLTSDHLYGQSLFFLKEVYEETQFILEGLHM